MFNWLGPEDNIVNKARGAVILATKRRRRIYPGIVPLYVRVSLAEQELLLLGRQAYFQRMFKHTVLYTVAQTRAQRRRPTHYMVLVRQASQSLCTPKSRVRSNVVNIQVEVRHVVGHTCWRVPSGTRTSVGRFPLHMTRRSLDSSCCKCHADTTPM